MDNLTKFLQVSLGKRVCTLNLNLLTLLFYYLNYTKKSRYEHYVGLFINFFLRLNVTSFLQHVVQLRLQFAHIKTRCDIMPIHRQGEGREKECRICLITTSAKN